MAKIYEFKTPQGNFELHAIRGIVTGAAKTSTTHVSGGGYVSVSSSSTIHDQIFIVDKNGKEHVLQFANWNFPVKPDHEVSAFWLTKNGNRHSFWYDEYVAAVNHTIDKKLFKTDDQLKGITQSKWGCLLPIVLIASLWLVGSAISIVAFLTPKQETRDLYGDAYVKVALANEHAKAETTLILGAVFIVVSIAIIVAYNVIASKKQKNRVSQIKAAVINSEYY